MRYESSIGEDKREIIQNKEDILLALLSTYFVHLSSPTGQLRLCVGSAPVAQV